VCHPVGDEQFVYNYFFDRVSKVLKVFSESCVGGFMSQSFSILAQAVWKWRPFEVKV
jgi:uncharacterized protein (DUF1919 family)